MFKKNGSPEKKGLDRWVVECTGKALEIWQRMRELVVHPRGNIFDFGQAEPHVQNSDITEKEIMQKSIHMVIGHFFPNHFERFLMLLRMSKFIQIVVFAYSHWVLAQIMCEEKYSL